MKELRSSFPTGLRIVRRIDRTRLFFGVILVASLVFGAPIRLNIDPGSPAREQLKKLNPDAKLYCSLAANLVYGTGYHDTFRNEETMPSIGHPLILSVACVGLGLSPARLSWLCLWVSLGLLACAVFIYCGSNLLVLGTVCLYAAFLSKIEWLAGNVETSIAFCNALLIFSLACFHRRGYLVRWAVTSGVALGVTLLVRPLYLYPMQVASGGVLIAAGVHYLRGRPARLPAALKGWLVLLFTAQLIVGATLVHSQLKYGDTRLTTGTYGAWPLYVANNIHIPPDQRYRIRESDYPAGFKEVLAARNSETSWQRRHAFLMDETVRYWKDHPRRALRGWIWRFQRFLGLHASMLDRARNRASVILWGPRIHAACVSLMLLLLAQRSWRIWKTGATGLVGPPSLGVVVALLFLLYAALHAFFVYVRFRHVTPCVPILVAALPLLACEAFRLSPVGLARSDPDQR